MNDAAKTASALSQFALIAETAFGAANRAPACRLRAGANSKSAAAMGPDASALASLNVESHLYALAGK